ncbi:MAG: hypothetical protein K8E24_006800 [Methanobacterium paludis]|nr:hypothetical protein [Methanobacterium paludis]
MLEQWENLEVLEALMQIEYFKVFGAAIENVVAEKIDIAVYSAEEV